MGNYIPNADETKKEMLKVVGVNSFEELFADAPEEIRLKDDLNIPCGLSELEISKKISAMADKNKIYKYIFRGAGAYDRYIPSIVKSVTSKEEFVTAYTPYQAEISQGILQSIFEFQTVICNLTGMDVANASVYDGATAAAESVVMCKTPKKGKFLISAAADPRIISTVKTYCFGNNTELAIVPEKDGATDINALTDMLDESVCGLYIQQPNFYGIVEDAQAICDLVHEKGAKVVMGVDPITLAVAKTPAEYGADIAVGEGQSLGLPLSYGGPYVGFMATTKAMMRKLPGRIVGETVDTEGRRGFVLTLQAREQHIKREKAQSNICSNEALCALTATVYCAAMGAEGLKQAAEQSIAKAHYLAGKLEDIGFKLKYNKDFMFEFVTTSPVCTKELLEKLEEKDILGGLALSENDILWCVTEKYSKEEIDMLIESIKEVLA